MSTLIDEKMLKEQLKNIGINFQNPIIKIDNSSDKLEISDNSKEFSDQAEAIKCCWFMSSVFLKDAFLKWDSENNIFSFSMAKALEILKNYQIKISTKEGAMAQYYEIVNEISDERIPIDVLKVLLDKGANPNLNRPGAVNPAFRIGRVELDVEFIKKLLKNGYVPTDDDKEEFLFIAEGGPDQIRMMTPNLTEEQQEKLIAIYNLIFNVPDLSTHPRGPKDEDPEAPMPILHSNIDNPADRKSDVESGVNATSDKTSSQNKSEKPKNNESASPKSDSSLRPK